MKICTNRSIFVGLSALVILVFHQPYVINTAAQENLAEIIHLIPDNIHVAVNKGDLPITITRQIDLIFKGNDTKIKVYAYPLRLEGSSLVSIPLERINIDPVMINATNQDISSVTVNVTLDPSDPVGNYLGQLVLFRAGGDFVVIPLSVAIEPKALHLEPPSITFNFDPGRTPEDRIIYLMSNVSIMDITPMFFVLTHTNASYPQISADTLDMTPSHVNLQANIPQPIKVHLNQRGDYKPGQYTSMMLLRYGNDTIASIPVVVNVNQLTTESTSLWIGGVLGFLVIGATASFFVSAFREGRRIKASVLNAIISVRNALITAISDSRWEDNKFRGAFTYTRAGLDEWIKDKDHVSAINDFQLAKAQFDSMRAINAEKPRRIIQGPPEKLFIDVHARIKKENGSILGISRSDKYLYIPVVILVAVGFLTLITQTQIPSDVLQFDSLYDGIFDVIAAFLLGFASQSAATTLFGWLRSE